MYVFHLVCGLPFLGIWTLGLGWTSGLSPWELLSLSLILNLFLDYKNELMNE